MTRLLLALAAVAATLLAHPDPASAHAGGLTPADGRGRLVSVRPAVPGLEVRVIENGVRLLVRNRTTERVVVTGGGDPIVIPPGRTVSWIDERATTQGRRIAPGRSLTWTVPLTAGDTSVVVTGVTTGAAPPIALLWWAAAALTAAFVVAAARRLRRGDLLLGVTGLIAAAASVGHAIGSTLAVESAPLFTTFLAAAGVNLLAWPLVAGGAVTALRGRAGGVLAVCGGAALTAVIVLPDVTSFHRGVVPFAGPAGLERALVVLALGLGAGVAVAGAGVLRELARRPAALLLAGVMLLGGCTRAPETAAVPASCGSAAPDAVPVNVFLRDGRAEPAPHRVAVPLRGTVLLGVAADAATEVHVHGYDLVHPVRPGTPACVLFVAGQPGLFDVEAHPSTLLAQIEVR